MYTDTQRADEFLTVSPKMLTAKPKDCFVVQARGDSMNKANTKAGPIDDGDYVIVDGSKQELEQGGYVLASIDGLATIKKVTIDRGRGFIALTPESTTKHMPIYVHASDEGSLRCHGAIVGVVPHIE